MAATKKTYIVKGAIFFSRKPMPFSKEIGAASKIDAEHKIKSLLGSNYGIRRSLIRVESIEEVAE